MTPNREEAATMSIEVRVPTVLRTHTDGARAVNAEGDTLRDLIEDLESRHEGLKPKIMADDGDLARFVNVYVNDEDARFLDGINTTLSDGDTVSILPAVAGGGR